MTRPRYPSHVTAGALALGLTLALLPALWPSDAMAQDACTDEATDLIAGRTINVGDVNVCNDETTLTVTYEATTPWCLLATDLHVATSESDIPQTNKGNPKPDEFAFGDEHDCAPGGTATFEIPLDDIGEDGVEPGDTVVIAAHAEVMNTETGTEKGAWGDGTRFVARGPWSTYFDYDVQETFNCLAAGGVEVGGACWFLGARGASCTATCVLNGGVYDEATRTYAGDLGTLENCEGVLTALGLPGEAGDDGCDRLGCFHEVFSDLRLRCVVLTEPGASAPGAERACACKF